MKRKSQLTDEQIEAHFAEAGQIVVIWSADDVKSTRPDLTDDQCRQVLAACKRRHDSSIGINWDVVEAHAEDLYPAPDDAQTERDD